MRRLLLSFGNRYEYITQLADRFSFIRFRLDRHHAMSSLGVFSPILILGMKTPYVRITVILQNIGNAHTGRTACVVMIQAQNNFL